MNSFDLKVGPLEEHGQHPLIDSYLTSRELLGVGAPTFLPASRYFLTTLRNISRGLESTETNAGVPAFLETTIQSTT